MVSPEIWMASFNAGLHFRQELRLQILVIACQSGHMQVSECPGEKIVQNCLIEIAIFYLD